MDRYECINFIIDNIKRRKTTFSFDATGVDESVISEAFGINLKLLCYVSSISYRVMTGFFRKTFIVNVDYNRETIDNDDIYVVSKNIDVSAIMSRFCGNFKECVYFVAKQNVSIEKDIRLFNDKYAVYHPTCEGYEYGSLNIMGYSVYKIKFIYRLKKDRLQEMRRMVLDKVDKVCKGLFLSDMPEEVKAYLAHNYLIVNTSYHLKLNASAEEMSCIHSAYGALINRKCVCQGYAEAFKMIMNKAGISCDIATGRIIGSDELHGWNIITFKNGKSYHIDVTWDDGEIVPKYTYFCKPDSTFVGAREWNKDCVKKCLYNDNVLFSVQSYLKANKTRLLKLGISSAILGV